VLIVDAGDKRWDFDPIAERYDGVVARSDGVHARYEEVLDAVVARAAVGQGDRVLDLGTGTGALALRCLLRGARVVGLDPSEAMLEKARAKAGCDHRVRFVQADAPFERIAYPSASFDVVVSSYAFHHVPHGKKPASLAEVFRVLKPGGRWAIGDLAFRDEQEEVEALARHNWLEEEYFVRLDAVEGALSVLGCDLEAEQFTPASWVLWTRTPGDPEELDQ
jgi:putative AdoMet-dependent methyltransferase